MAYQYKDLGTFDGVVSVYNSIKPVRGQHAIPDRRPLGARRYWWERVVKMDENTYVLNDGYWTTTANLDALRLTAPIMWERKPDGDFITIRSHMNGGVGVSRYWFLTRYLPDTMRFHYANGKHFVHCNGRDYYLPKSSGSIDWAVGQINLTKDCKIVFKCEADGSFTRWNDLQPFKTRRINKDLDKEYKPKIAALWEWMQAVLPVLGKNLSNERYEYAKQLLGGNNGAYWDWANHITPELARSILDDEEHPLRLAYGAALANEIGARQDGMFMVKPESVKNLRAVVRKTAGLFAVEYK